MKFIFLASKELSWLGNLGFHFPKLDCHQWLRVHIFAIWEIHTSRRIQHVFIVKTVCYLRKKLSRDLGSPGSRQLLQLQLFSQFFWNYGPSFFIFILSCLGVCGFMNSVLFFPLLQFGLKWCQLLSCFSKNRFLSANALTVEFWKRCLFGLNDFPHRYRKSVYVQVGACFSLLSLFRGLSELFSSLPSLNLLNT